MQHFMTMEITLSDLGTRSGELDFDTLSVWPPSCGLTIHHC